MKQLIKIILLFFLLYIFCQSLGIFANNKLKLCFKKYYFFIGFIIILGIYEILMIFPLLYNLSSIFSYVSGFIILLICIYSIIIEKNNLIKNLKSKKQIHLILLLCFTVLLFFVSGNAVNDFNDTFFYESFIAENTRATTLNYINIYQSGYSFMSHQYGYDAYYHFLALLSNIFKINPHILMTWLSPFIYSIFHFSVYAEIIEQLNFQINKKLLYIPIYLSIFIGLFNSFELSFIGNCYNPPILSIIILMLLKNDTDIKQSLFIFICFFAGISTQSTFIIYSIIIIVAKSFHIVINKEEKQIHNMCFYMTPVLFFALLTFTKSFNLLQAFQYTDILIGLVSISITFLLNKFLNLRRLKVCCLVFSLFIYIISIILVITNNYLYGPLDFINSLNPYGDGFNYLKITFELTILIIIIIHSIKSKDYNYIFVLISVSLLLFFNPLTISFVSTYLTNVVYLRIFNICTCFIVTYYSISLVKNIYVYALLLLLIINKKPTSNIIFYNRNTDNLLYRLSYDSINAFNKLDELTQNYKQKTGFPPSTFTTDLRSQFITKDAGYIFNLSVGRILLSGNNDYDSFRTEQICDLYSALTRGPEYDTPEYISNVISNQSIKFLLIGSDQTNEAIKEIEKTCELDYKNNSYLLYSCNQ